MAKANSFKAPVIAEASETEVDYSPIASRLCDAYSETSHAVKAIEEEYQSALVSRKSALLDSIREVAEDYEGMDGAEFDLHVKDDLAKALTEAEFKAVPSRVSVLKIAFLAFANGIKPVSEKAQRNLQHFVNDEARDALLADNIIKATGKGRKSGSTAKASKDAMLEAAIVLARHGDVDLDADVVKARAAKLRALATAGNWKLLDKLLDQGLKSAGIKLA